MKTILLSLFLLITSLSANSQIYYMTTTGCDLQVIERVSHNLYFTYCEVPSIRWGYHYMPWGRHNGFFIHATSFNQAGLILQNRHLTFSLRHRPIWVWYHPNYMSWYFNYRWGYWNHWNYGYHYPGWYRYGHSHRYRHNVNRNNPNYFYGSRNNVSNVVERREGRTITDRHEFSEVAPKKRQVNERTNEIRRYQSEKRPEDFQRPRQYNRPIENQGRDVREYRRPEPSPARRGTNPQEYLAPHMREHTPRVSPPQRQQPQRQVSPQRQQPQRQSPSQTNSRRNSR